MGCLKESPLWTESDKARDLWNNSESIETWGFGDDVGAYKTLFETATGKPFEAGSGITATDMKKFQVSIKDLSARLKTPGLLSNKILKSFYIGVAKSWRNPITDKFMTTLINANEFRNSHTTEMMAEYESVVGNIKLALMEADGIDTGNLDTGNFQKRSLLRPSDLKKKNVARNKFKELNKREQAIVAKIKSGESVDITKEVEQLLKYVENEAPAFQDFMDLVLSRDSSLLKEKYRGQPNAKNYIRNLELAAQSWRKIESSSKKHLIQSIDNLTEIVQEKYGEYSNTAKFLVKEYKDISKKLGEFEDGYVPHYVLDLFKDSIELSEAISKSTSDGQRDNIITEYTSKLADINSGLINRLKAKSRDKNEPFSRNPALYIEKYVEQVAQFNHRTFIDKAYVKGLKQMSKVMLSDPTSKEAKTAEVFQRILTDLHSDATGVNRIEQSPQAQNITRLLTSLQFVSKLGWSTRGALRNGTQRLLNNVWFGSLHQVDTMKAFAGNEAYRAEMNQRLLKHGLKFIDVSKVTEGAVTAADMTAYNVEIGKNGMLSYSSKQTLLQKMTKAGVKTAEASSILTKWAENWNRKSTFKVAFHLRVKQLKKTDKYASVEADPVKQAALEKDMYDKAGHYASKMTSLLHFEYSPFGKADVLKSGPGAVLGQFQHYAMSFAQLQMKMVNDYKRAFKAGDYTGPELGRIVRMGMLHSMAMLASGVFDIDFTSYINNDTAQRATELVKLMSGDEEAFYGKGAIGAIGAVPLSDAVEIINLGAAAGYWELLADPKSTQGFLLGMRDYQKIDNSEFAGEVAGMFSIEADRLWNRTGPALAKGQFLAAIRAELGLYPGEMYGVKTRDFRKKINEKMGLSTPTKTKSGPGWKTKGWRGSSFDSKKKFKGGWKGKGWKATLDREQRESAIESLRSLS